MSLDPISAGIDLAKTVVDKVWPDAGQAEKDKIAMIVAMTQQQNEINANEAKSTSTYVSGARPSIIWSFSIIILFNYVIQPIVTILLGVWLPSIHLPPLPIDDALWNLVLGVLGLGGMRTFEKIKGVASK